MTDYQKRGPYTFNIELTTRCLFSCPKCYCSLTGGKDISLDVAKKRLKEAALMGIREVSLSGGESLLHPALCEIIAYAHSLGIETAIATSGWGLDKKSLEKIMAAGLSELYVSLNGSSDEINSYSRQGYEYAIKALKLLKESPYSNYYINWVAQSNNVDDFENLIALAEGYGVRMIVVLGLRPDSDNRMEGSLDFSATRKLAEMIIKNNMKRKLFIGVEHCYSELKTYMAEVTGNQDFALCRAGDKSFAVTVDGNFVPCRHLEIVEEYDTVSDYLFKSEVLRNIRASKNIKGMKCLMCKHSEHCGTCLAMAYKLEGVIKSNNAICRLPRSGFNR